MIKHPFYLFYGLLTIAGAGWMQFRGYGNASINEVRQVPKSIRDNPGAYRSHYGYIPRYTGGK